MAEMIIPGTYVTVRAEGLISAGRIATGILGVVGTAASGPIGKAVTLSGFGNARELFGAPDDFSQPDDGAHPLTLIRALEQAYNNGASTVIAVRAASSARGSATYAVLDKDGRTLATLSASTPGTWGNQIRVQVEAAQEPARISREVQTGGFARLRYAPVVPSAENQLRVLRGITKRTDTLSILYKRAVTNERVTPDAGGRFFLANKTVEPAAAITRVQTKDASGNVTKEYTATALLFGAGAAPAADQIRINTTTGELTFAAGQVPAGTSQVFASYGVGYAGTLAPGQVLVTTWDGALQFATGDGPQQANGDQLTASYLVDKSAAVRVTLRNGATTERYTVPDGRVLAQLINDGSSLATALAAQNQEGVQPALVDAYFGTGSNTSGNNGADAGPDDYAAALELLSTELVNLVVLAGQDAETMGSVLLAHLNATEGTDHERMGVIGSKGRAVGDILGHTMASDRIILVAPGIAFPDGTTLPAAYTAAAVAGLMSTLDVQASLTNKPLNVPGLSLVFNRGEQEQLIGRNVLAVVRKEGFRVLKGITTSGEGTPFSSIPIRRIVDYAKYGVRSAANPYIGRLNNARVRGALKATVDAFLTRMVEDEALTAYELEVSATRAQEIAGEVSVTMTIQPTFSIDFVRVTMILK